LFEFFEAFRSVRLPILHTFDLSPNSDNRPEGFLAGLEKGNFPNLHVMRLREMQVGRREMEVLGKAASAKRLLELEELDLLETNAHEGGEFLAQALGAGQLPKLKKLCLPLRNECISALTRAFGLNDLPALERLQVRSRFREGGLRALAEGLRPSTLPSLERLDFFSIGVGSAVSVDEGEVLGSALNEGRLPALKNVSLSGMRSAIDRLRERDWGIGREIILNLFS